ncbi:MAG: hypothetical protein JWM41_2171 [Gemmatimonadetes bacterium]|nr:hypothetical protein [Gemmatimonadota bacterium]
MNHDSAASRFAPHPHDQDYMGPPVSWNPDHTRLATVRVVDDEVTGGTVLINHDDFDPAEHTVAPLRADDAAAGRNRTDRPLPLNVTTLDGLPDSVHPQYRHVGSQFNLAYVFASDTVSVTAHQRRIAANTLEVLDG